MAIGAALALLVGVPSLFAAQASRPQTRATRLSSIKIVLPPRLVADAPATLATIGADDKLVGHVPVLLSNGTKIETDATGRANFTAPSGVVMTARAGGGSAAALIDPPAGDTAPDLQVPPFVALHSSFELCGSGFDGNAEANHVTIDGEPALVLAASPECLLLTPGPSAVPGVEKIIVESASPARQASVTLVELDFEPPQPALTPGKKGWLTVRARGSQQPLRIMVQNESFDVLRFEKGDVQELTTSGGAENVAEIRVQAIRSGDFSFHARILPPANTENARRFLQAAGPLAIGEVPQALEKMSNDLAHHPQSAEKIRAQLDQMLEVTSPSEFRTLLEAARSSL